MENPLILLLDFTHSSELAEALQLALRGMFEADPVIHYANLRGPEVRDTLERLSTVSARVVPDLILLLLSEEAQASAAGIFSVLLAQESCPSIVAVPSSDEPSAIADLYRLGASDYLRPPYRTVDVHPRLQRLLSHRLSRKTPLAVLKRSLGLKQFVGESPVLLEQLKKLPQFARSNGCVLITGETGTGKEVCARAIHVLSPRADHPFVPLNCGAIPADLLENELFGHQTGAFTSANAPHAGVICEANGGTLFLDEIDSLPLGAQVKLLRFLQDKEYRPLGARKVSKADVRIIAAANGNVDELLPSGKMRQDLFYRLNVLPIRLPPLRERKEDIPLLAVHFLGKYRDKSSSTLRSIDPGALRKLVAHDWPGNVRELENVIERGMVLSEGGAIRSADIDLPNRSVPDAPPESFSRLKAEFVAEFERKYLRTVLDQHGGNIGQAARAAQKNRRAFFQLMRKHQIRVDRPSVASVGKQVVNLATVVDKNVHAPSGVEVQ